MGVSSSTMRSPGRSDDDLAPGRDRSTREAHLHEPAAGAGRRVDDQRPVAGDGGAQGPQGAVGQAVGDLGGLGEAVQHGGADLVDRAGADRVVGAVAQDLQPGQVEEGLGPVLRREQQRRQGLGQPLEASARRSRRPASRRRGSRPPPSAGWPGRPSAARRSSGGGRRSARRGGGRPASRCAARSRPRARSPRPRPGRATAAGMRWSVPFIQRSGPTRRSPCSASNSPIRRRRALASSGTRAPLPYPSGQVLGPHGRAVGRGPPEPAAVHRATARPARRRRARSRAGAGAGASARRGRTCRAGSRPPWRRRTAPPPRGPRCRLRTRVSPDTRNSSGRAYHGPIATRPPEASVRRRSSASGRTAR